MGWRDKVLTGEVLTDEEKAAFARETGTAPALGSMRFKVELEAKVTEPDGTAKDLGMIGSTEHGTITTVPATPGGA